MPAVLQLGAELIVGSDPGKGFEHLAGVAPVAENAGTTTPSSRWPTISMIFGSGGGARAEVIDIPPLLRANT